MTINGVENAQKRIVLQSWFQALWLLVIFRCSPAGPASLHRTLGSSSSAWQAYGLRHWSTKRSRFITVSSFDAVKVFFSEENSRKSLVQQVSRRKPCLLSVIKGTEGIRKFVHCFSASAMRVEALEQTAVTRLSLITTLSLSRWTRQ